MVYDGDIDTNGKDRTGQVDTDCRRENKNGIKNTGLFHGSFPLNLSSISLATEGP